MRASFRQGAPADTQADTLCFGLFEGEEAPADLDQALGGRLGAPDRVRRGEGLLQEGRGAASRRRRSAPRARSPSASASATSSRPSAPASPRAVGLARARDAGATPRRLGRSRRRRPGRRSARALAEGALLAAYRFDRYKSGDDDNGSKGPEEVEIVSGEDLVGRDPRGRRRGGAPEHRARPAEPALERPHARRSWPSTRCAARPRSRDSRASRSAPTRSQQRAMGGLLVRHEGLARGAALHRAALRRRGRRAAARAGRQGGHVRHRRHLDQALGEDAGDEDGHVGRRPR